MDQDISQALISVLPHRYSVKQLFWTAGQKNTDSKKRVKHVDLKHHFVQEANKTGLVNHMNIDSDKNPADGFNKPSQKVKFEKLGDQIAVNHWIQNKTVWDQEGWYAAKSTHM